MNTTAVIVFTIEIATVVAGQVLIKHAIQESKQFGLGHSRVLTIFFGGVASMAVSFFLTLALLQHFDLSYFFPLQASTTILIVLLAAIFLREHLSLRLIVGSLLITVGIVIVSMS
jgi:uncharacterized membrane protein